MLKDYYEATIQGYNTSGYEEIEAETFPHWESFLLPFLQPGAAVLDLGCGSGVYAKRFQDKGYCVSAIDAAPRLCKHAEKLLGQRVRCLRFDELEDEHLYDGVFANVSLLHVSKQDYPDIFRRVYRALKEKGYFYASFKEGSFEGFRPENNTYFTEMTPQMMQELLERTGLFKTAAVERTPFQQTEDQHWIHFVLEKIDPQLRQPR